LPVASITSYRSIRQPLYRLFRDVIDRIAIDQNHPGGLRPVCWCALPIQSAIGASRSVSASLVYLVRLRRIPRRRGTGTDGEAVPNACVAFPDHRAKPIGNQPGSDAVDGVGGLNGSLRWEEI
jgi:hypothetical protein